MTTKRILVMIGIFTISELTQAQEPVEDDRREGTDQELLEKALLTDREIKIAGPLTASKDLFQKSVAYEFGSSFFKPRGLRSSDQRVLLNGVLLNKPLNGRMEWSNVGGLNDALRQQEVFFDFRSSPYLLGGIGQTINLKSYAEDYAPGLKVSVALANKTYGRRLMASYFSRWTERNWKFSLSASHRSGEQGFRQGTNYSSFSFFASLDKVWPKGNRLNGTIIYANTVSGRAAPITSEVYELKGPRYNPYWGWHQGQKRNSREKRVAEPILQFNYRWQLSSRSHLDNHLTLQFGESGRSRLDYSGARNLKGHQGSVGGGENPDPTYYQFLPSYFLRFSDNPDLSGAFLAREEIQEKGQLEWDRLFAANTDRGNHTNAIYALFEDVTSEHRLSVKSDFHHLFTGDIIFDASMAYDYRLSRNFARITDLLGGDYYLDVNSFEEKMDRRPNDLRNPERKVLEGDNFRYDFDLQVKRWMGFARLLYRGRRTELYAGLHVENFSYCRTGNYENGRYPGALSFGKGKEMSFFMPGFKTGLTYKLNGRHLFGLNGAYLKSAPGVKDSYFNIRENHAHLDPLKEERQMALDAFYLMREPRITAKLSVYALKAEDRSQMSFYYANGLNSLEMSQRGTFVQEMLTGVEAESIGSEISIGYRLAESILLKAVGAFGKVTYTNDPELFVSSDDLEGPTSMGRSYLRGYQVGSGPQTAISVGFEYSDPDYWWFSLSGNYFDRSYVQVAPVLRTQNFLTARGGMPIAEPDRGMERKLLEQEKLPSYWTLNLVGGKSWKVGDAYLGCFGSINNALNRVYRTGGFEQSRNADYESYLEDRSRKFPLFGNKYWFGFGASFFVSVYLRM